MFSSCLYRTCYPVLQSWTSLHLTWVLNICVYLWIIQVLFVTPYQLLHCHLATRHQLTITHLLRLSTMDWISLDPSALLWMSPLAHLHVRHWQPAILTISSPLWSWLLSSIPSQYLLGPHPCDIMYAFHSNTGRECHITKRETDKLGSIEGKVKNVTYTAVPHNVLSVIS